MTQVDERVPKLLVSVRSAEELEAALVGGADWIDLKEPNDGALAAVDRATAHAASELLAGRRKLSAALGELRELETSAARELLSVPGIEVVKLGLSGCGLVEDWRQQWNAVASEAATNRKQLVAVIYADWQDADAPPPKDVLALGTEAGCGHVLIDTYHKDGRSTFDCLEQAELAEILHEAYTASMKTVLAGSISKDLVARLPSRHVDIVAVRGAVCSGDRKSQVDAKLVESFQVALKMRFSDAALPVSHTS